MLLRGNQSKRDPTTILGSPNSLSRRSPTISQVPNTTDSQSSRPKKRSTILWSMVLTRSFKSKRSTLLRERKRRGNLSRSKRLQWLILSLTMMPKLLRINSSMTRRNQKIMKISQTIRNLKNLINSHVKNSQKSSKLTPLVQRKELKSHLLNKSNKYL
jgi:hypothetical protein